MGQNEIMELLRVRRLTGDNDFINACEISKLLNDKNPANTRRCINKLYAYGYLDIEIQKGWIRAYRLKDKYLKEVISDISIQI